MDTKKYETLLDAEATKQVMELIKEGWEFSLHFGDHSSYCDLDLPCWEADFTIKLANGKWDNHECGYSYTPGEAINQSYMNIKNGNRFHADSRIL
jgi:hypothetical protein